MTDNIDKNEVPSLLHHDYPRDTLAGLYEAWHLLPPCNLLALVGGAIQEIQYYQQELAIKPTAESLLDRIQHELQTFTLPNEIDPELGLATLLDLLSRNVNSGERGLAEIRRLCDQIYKNVLLPAFSPREPRQVVDLPDRVIGSILYQVGLPNSTMPDQEALERLVLKVRDAVVSRIPPEGPIQIELSAHSIKTILKSVGLPNADMADVDALQKLVLAARDEVVARIPADRTNPAPESPKLLRPTYFMRKKGEGWHEVTAERASEMKGNPEFEVREMFEQV